MASFDRLKEGQILYRYDGVAKKRWFEVKVLEIDREKREVFCSTNNNPPHWWSERKIKSLYVKRRKD